MATTLTPRSASAVRCPDCSEAVMMWVDSTATALSLCTSRKAAMGGFAALAMTYPAALAETLEPVTRVADWPAEMLDALRAITLR